MQEHKVIFDSTTQIDLSYFFNKYAAARIGRNAPVYRALREHDFAVFANDYIGIQINVFGWFEKEQLDVLFEFLAPVRAVFRECTALDIGANVGNHTLYFSRFFKYVHCFEPNDQTFYLLGFNTSGLENVAAHHYGLGNTAGTFNQIDQPTNKGGNAIRAPRDGETSSDIEVRSLDHLDIEFDNLSFIKIDVEGFEARVLEGGRRLLERHMPIVVLEQLEQEFQDGTTPSLELLSSLGYRFCWHERGIDARNILPKPVANVVEYFFGRKHRIKTCRGAPPRGEYPMLISVPPRFHGLLGLNP